MKALVAQELSGPAGLVYTDVDDPADVADSDMVVVDVGVAGVSFPDLLLIKGEYQLKLDPPFVPGTEVAGVVRSAPADSGFTVGQRVTGLSMLGAWAERVALLPASVQPTPDEHRRRRGGVPARQLLHDVLRAGPARRAARR